MNTNSGAFEKRWRPRSKAEGARARNQRGPGAKRLAPGELIELSLAEFPLPEWSEEQGRWVFTDQQETLLHQFFHFHGLRFGSHVSLAEALSIWRHIRVVYSAVIRTAANSCIEDAGSVVARLSPDERRYCEAVGRQDVTAAQEAAMTLFPSYVSFHARA